MRGNVQEVLQKRMIRKNEGHGIRVIRPKHPNPQWENAMTKSEFKRNLPDVKGLFSQERAVT